MRNNFIANDTFIRKLTNSFKLKNILVIHFIFVFLSLRHIVPLKNYKK